MRVNSAGYKGLVTTGLLGALFVLCSGASKAADEPAAIDKAAEDAKALVADWFPTSKELGPTWKVPWEPSGDKTETNWHKKQLDPLWVHVRGLPKASVEAEIGEFLKAKEKEQREYLPPQGPLTAFMAVPENAMLSCLADVHLWRAPQLLELPAVLRTRRLSGFAKEGLDRLPNETPQEAISWDARYRETTIQVMFPDLVGKSTDEIVRRVARDSLAVKKYAAVRYTLADATGETPNNRTEVTIEMIVADKGALPRVPEPTPEQLKTIATDLQKGWTEAGMGGSRRALQHAGKSPAEMKDELTKFRTAMVVKAGGEKRSSGDYSCVVSVECTTDEKSKGGSYFARLRNGTAVVNIVLYSSTRDAEWMAKQMEFFLTTMDKRTEFFRNK